jgi:hypothetical protein
LGDYTLFPYESFDNSYAISKLFTNADEILTTGWQRRCYKSLDLKAAIPWKLERPEQRSQNYHIQCLDMLDVLLRAYSHTHDLKYLNPTLPIALDWIEKHSDLQQTDISPFAWYDMSVGLRAYRLAYLYEAAANAHILGEDVRRQLWLSLEQHANYLADDSNISFHNNHGYYQIAGQIAMGRRLSSISPLMAMALEQGRERLQQILELQFSSDGVHREHSPDYHRMVYDTLKALIDAKLVDNKKTIDFALRIEEALSWFVLPNQHIVNFGDSDDRIVSRNPANTIQKWSTPEMRFWVSGGIIGKPSIDLYRVFSEGGYWVARKAGSNPNKSEEYSYLALNAAFHSRTHKHADDLSLVWFEHGYNLLVDAGRYGYIGKSKKGSELWLDGFWYSNPWRVYCESTRAHNTLEFDDRNLPRKSVKPYGSALRRWGVNNSELLYVESECKYFRTIRHARVLFFLPSKWLIVFDWFHDNTGAPHSVKQWFHVGYELEMTNFANQFNISLPGVQQSLSISSLLQKPAASRLYFGEKNPIIQGWFSTREAELFPNYAFYHELSDVDNGVFATLFSFSNKLRVDYEWAKVSGSGRKGQFRWQDESGIHSLRFERPIEGEIIVNYNVNKKSSKI